MLELITTWVLLVMTALEPKTPWKDTYPTTARAIAEIATEEPLYAGELGKVRTAALLTSLAWFESTFNPSAQGDCNKKDDKGRCVADPQSLCLFQIGKSNLKTLGITEEEILSDVTTCAKAARKMIQISKGVCRNRPDDEILGNYASGGSECGGVRESVHRVNKAKYLLSKFTFSMPH